MVSKNMKSIISYGLVLVVMSLLWSLIVPSSMTTLSDIEPAVIIYEKKYDDVSKYTTKCEQGIIRFVASYYQQKEEYDKCHEWILKSNKCATLQPDYKKEFLVNPSKECKPK